MNQLKIETLPIEALAPYENNTRAHNDDDVAQIARSIQRYGFNDPIGIWSDKNIIVEGHGRPNGREEPGAHGGTVRPAGPPHRRAAARVRHHAQQDS